MDDLIKRITEYIAHGGLFNPDLMDHAEVSRLLIDVRDYLVAQKKLELNLQDLPTYPWKPENWRELERGKYTLNGGCSVCGISGVNGLVCYNTQCPNKVSCQS